MGAGTSNGSGVVSLAAIVDPGVYSVILDKTGYRSPRPAPSITVPDTGGVTPYAPSSIAMVPLGITDPSGIAYCTVYGFFSASNPSEVRLFVEIGSQGDANWLQPSNPGSAVDKQPVFQVAEVRQIQVEASGRFSLDVPVGAMVKLSVPESRLHKFFRVPAQDAVNLKDVRLWLGSSDGISLSENVGTNFSQGSGTT